MTFLLVLNLIFSLLNFMLLVAVIVVIADKIDVGNDSQKNPDSGLVDIPIKPFDNNYGTKP